MTAPTVAADDERALMAAAYTAARRYLAAHPGMPGAVMDDVLSDACFGAALAYRRHDPTKGASLLGLAMRRASGAVIDGVRQRAPMSRDEYRANPDPGEVARRTPTSLDEFAVVGRAYASLDEGHSRVDDADELVRLLRLCTPTERYTLVAVVMYGFPACEVARRLGVTNAAIAQAKRRGLARLRAAVT